MQRLFTFISSLSQWLRRLCRSAAVTAIALAIIGVTTLSITPAASAQTIRVVDASSTATTPDGTSWATAYKHLQDAIADQAGSGITQIWVAAGTYKPDRDSVNPSGTGSRNATFAMNDNLEIYGGFVGNESLDGSGFRSRNPATNVTILSGDLDSDGLDDENSYHIVTANAVSNTAILDGFTITMGYAVDAPELIENEADTEGVGAGLVVLGGPGPSTDVVQAVFLRLRFTVNEAASGGATYIRAGQNNSPQFRNCQWDNNNAGGGAAVTVSAAAIGSASTPKFYNCLFRDNTSSASGSAMASGAYGTPHLINCTVTQNDSESLTGAALAHSAAEGQGFPRTGHIELANSIVWNNTRLDDVTPVIDLAAQLAGDVDPSYSDITDLGSPYPTSPGNIDADPVFASAGSNDFRLICGSPCINTAFNSGLDTPMPADGFDLNQDNNTSEYNPDLALAARMVSNIDMGAYEKPKENCLADTDGNCAVDVDDLVAVILGWGTPCSNCVADISPAPCGGDGNVDVDDLIAVILAWGTCDNCTPTGEGAGVDPESYADCQELCMMYDGDQWIACMQSCLWYLCNEKQIPEYCEE